jgi:hypothetical protein
MADWRDSYLIDFLKKTNSRISVGGGKWLYYDNATNEWVVVEQEYRNLRTLYRDGYSSQCLGEALEILEPEWDK